MKTTRIASSNIFVSHKTSGRAIPVRSPSRRDFLVQSTLDPHVRRIEYHPAMRVDDSIIPVDAILIDSDEGRHAIDFSDARPAFDPIGENLLHLAFSEGCNGVMYVTNADIRREPLFSASREVWRHHPVRVHTRDREQILCALQSEGPMTVRSLDGLVHTSRDLEQVIYSLACSGDVELDLRDPLGDRSIVRVGMRSFSNTDRLVYGT